MTQAARRNSVDALREHLFARWRHDRDEAALDLLLAAVPADMPAETWLAVRNAAIVNTARWLHAMTNGSRNQIAEIIAEAGARLSASRPLPLSGPIFKSLASDERDELSERLGTVLKLRPERLTESWPRARMVNGILEAANGEASINSSTSLCNSGGLAIAKRGVG